MLNVSEIVQSFEPVLEEVRVRANKNQATPLDVRITDLIQKLKKAISNGKESMKIEEVEIVNTHLSNQLTLADLQISFETCPEAANRIISYLDIQKNFDEFDKNFNELGAQFSTIERIKTTSAKVLQHVNLIDVQFAGLVYPVKNSSTWLAFSSDKLVLNEQVEEFRDVIVNTDIVSAKIREIETQNPELLNNFKSTPFSSRSYSLDLTIGKLRVLSKEELDGIANTLPSSAFSLLSDTQLSSLDYSQMDKEQAKGVFGPYLFQNKKELKRRIQLIPEKFVNDVVNKVNLIYDSRVKQDSILEYLSPAQYSVLDTSLLSQKVIQNLFPGFTTGTLHPRYKYEIRDAGPHYGMQHKFEKKGSTRSYSKKELDEKFEENKIRCINIAKNFTSQQLLKMKPFMYSECQDLI